ncbi:uncharacterized protein K02A2.6-like [Saccostrea cucullata]|uniref:uncharacterized protein K02A2.6-like n=1 Tax=Saccostrea cuccullata TaxID=36930 RepID=UPI002ED2152C
MELDTGTALSIISEQDYLSTLQDIKLHPCDKTLKSYSGHTMRPIEGITTDHVTNFDQLLKQRKIVFAEGIGKLKDIKAHLTLTDTAHPKFLKARSVPYAMCPKIEKELDRLQNEGIIRPVAHSDLATPIVPALKKNGDIRICGDYRVTVNPVLKVDQYQLPKIEDIFANLSGGRKFSKIDLTQAFHQMELDEASKQLLVINTHKGLYMYNRLVFGIASAPAMWQRAIEQVLQGIPHTQCILNDIIITGTSDEDHKRTSVKCCHASMNMAYVSIWTNDILASEQVLCHYNPDLPLKLACDAFPYGIGCVLSHTFSDGSERPIAYASRALKKAERGYSQIDKEALSIYWGIQKFNTYLFGKHFTLITDHKPLLSIFHPSKALPAMTAARLQRYAVFLSGHSYDIIYKSTHKHCNADALSRLPLDSTETEGIYEVDMFYSTHLKPYIQRKDELTLHQGCIMWGNRVVIPESLHSRLLEEIHAGHLGIVRMKTYARSYVWWPNIDSALEQTCRSCAGCLSVQNQPTAAPVHPWDWPETPWYRVHVDYAGPFKNAMFLIVVDAHSKWLEVFHMTSTTALATIKTLRTLFARQSIPNEVVSDNGPQFISAEFKQFMVQNGIRHITSAPYHPRTNGQAERFVQSFKRAIKSADNDKSATINQKLCAFLFKYRTTPHATTNETPSVKMYGRNIRSRLDLVKPNTANVVHKKQHEVPKHVGTNICEFENGQPVLVRDYREGRRWTKGNVTSRTGPLSYHVDVNGSTWHRHVDQMKDTILPGDVQSEPPLPVYVPDVPLPRDIIAPGTPVIPEKPTKSPLTDKPVPLVTNDPIPLPKPDNTPRRYPQRIRKPTQKLDL